MENRLKIKDRKNILLLITFCLLGVICCVIAELPLTVETAKNKTTHTIVVDCGHGGIDPGKVGVNGAYEKDINLAIGKYLKEALEKKDCQVIMTRQTDEGLYESTDTNKKIADLKNRVALMNQESVDLVVSIHQNSFSGGNSKGAQVFYHTGSTEGEALAKILQEQLICDVDPQNHRQAKANAEYYLLKNTEKTTVIVECGFLSNQEEAQKLCDETYQRQIAEAIAQGTMKYLSAKQE